MTRFSFSGAMRQTRGFLRRSTMTGFAFVLLLCACSPHLDWREVRAGDRSFTVMLPAKPASFTRLVNLENAKVNMTMTAAEVDDVTYAVATAELPDPAAATKALQSMKTSLVRNINGTIKQEKTSIAPPLTNLDVEAIGASAGRKPQLMVVRLVAKDKRVYQVLIVGPEKAVSREAIDTFFSSFKPN